MAGFDWFWRAMGSGKNVNQKRSVAISEQAFTRAKELEQLSDAEIAKLARGEHRIDFLAAVVVAASRTLGQKPFVQQIQAVLRLLDGDVIQMATGEGKTLVGAMAATGFALQGKRVHVITVNDYLARRDAEWMRPLVSFFGLNVGSITSVLDSSQRAAIYAGDVIYASVTEIGFDVLRDRQVSTPGAQVQTPPDVAIVDEADSVLVDEALVPLVLAGSQPGQAPVGHITAVVSNLDPEQDYTVDGDGRTVSLTDQGARRIERELGISSLYDDDHVGTTLVHVNVALHAHALLLKDVHYLVRDGQVQLIDASRGRVANLQRWPDGLQAAVEAKEGLQVTEGGRVLDSTTIQALMGRYPTLCGMTGTAVEATDQLREFYGLRVSVIERNKELQRFDEADRVFATVDEKNRAIVREIAQLHSEGRPVLVGTHDVAESEELAHELGQQGIEVSVLNAKNDAEEAGIIAEAGDMGRVTVSTQMAGRGTDIRLGGASGANYDEVVKLGGLAVIGTSRHRTARLDNQLRGRAGRQGDPGLSLFFVSLEDDIVLAGGEEKIVARPDEYGEIGTKKIRNFIEHCQRVTEGQLLEIHSQTWKYNKLLADQREIIDTRRRVLLDTPKAWEELSLRDPESAAKWEAVLDDAQREQGAREIMLAYLDREWSEHVEMLNDVRESIHLRALARETPLDEFHRIAVREFKELAQRAVDRAIAAFSSAKISASEGLIELDRDVIRPSATWTYMVSDNPLAGGRGQSLASGIGDIFR